MQYSQADRGVKLMSRLLRKDRLVTLNCLLAESVQRELELVAVVELPVVFLRQLYYLYSKLSVFRAGS